MVRLPAAARLSTLRRTIGLALGACFGVAGYARAADPVPPPAAPAPAAAALATARKENVERLGKELKKLCSSPRAAKERAQIDTDLESLVALGGTDSALAAIEALAFDDEATEKKVFAIVETARDKSLVKPLAAMVTDKDTRRRFRLHVQIAHALSAIADVSALETLCELVGSENAHVVAAAGEAFVAFKSAPHAKRVEPVRRILDVFESTWNLKESRRAEDRIQTDEAKTNWEVYGASLRKAIQALSGQSQFTRPRQFRDWWNDHKKATNW